MQNNFERAKIFSPFDALKGLNEALLLQEKIINEKSEYDENYNSYLNKKISSLKVGDKVMIKYYYNLDYIETIGIIKKIDFYNKVIYIMNSKINFEDILDIEI